MLLIESRFVIDLFAMQDLDQRQCNVSKEALQSGVNALTFVFR